MSETYDKWFSSEYGKFPDNEQERLFMEKVKSLCKPVWHHQQAKIDELEIQIVDMKDELAFARKESKKLDDLAKLCMDEGVDLIGKSKESEYRTFCKELITVNEFYANDNNWDDSGLSFDVYNKVKPCDVGLSLNYGQVESGGKRAREAAKDPTYKKLLKEINERSGE